MLKWLESLIDAYPEKNLHQPMPQGFLAFVWEAASSVRRYLFLVLIFTALVSATEVLLFSHLGDLVTLISKSQPQDFLRQHQQSLWMLFGILLANIVFATLQSLLMHQVIMGNFPTRLRWRFHNILLQQSLDFFHNDFAGRLSAKVMQAALAVREFWILLADIIAFVIIYFITINMILGAVSLYLLIPLTIWLVLFIITASFFIPQFNKIAKKQADARAVMTGRITDAYTNIQTVKLFAHAGRESQYAKGSMQDFMLTVYKMMRYGSGYQISVLILSVVLYVGVIGTAIYLWSQGQAEVGVIAAAVAMTLRLNSLAEFMMWQTTALFEHVGTIQDAMKTFSLPLDLKDQDDAKTLNLSHGEIKFDQVNFAYKERKVIDQLSLTIRPGEKIGIVGRSGAGKSTLIQLLLNFYKIQSGHIYIDGQDISTVTEDSLRRQIALVTQDTSLLHRTVAENIKYGRPDASDEEMYAAVKKAKADEFIPQLTDLKGRSGYAAYVGERGVKLSGGQRQRIAIARVFLKDAPILILDEATSALDSEVEAAIQQSLNDLMQGKTVIAIAHRLSTIAQMDRLIVLDQGHIVEQGSHEELISQQGIYAQLWQRQTGGFLFEQN
jgi:ATP-binding cassette, subfamily B, multidrug efflux pump